MAAVIKQHSLWKHGDHLQDWPHSYILVEFTLTYVHISWAYQLLFFLNDHFAPILVLLYLQTFPFSRPSLLWRQMHCSYTWTEAELSSHSWQEQPPQLTLTSRRLPRALHVPRAALGFTPGSLCLHFSLPNLEHVSSDKQHKQDTLIYCN